MKQKTNGCGLDLSWSKTFQGLMSSLRNTLRGLRSSSSKVISEIPLNGFSTLSSTIFSHLFLRYFQYQFLHRRVRRPLSTMMAPSALSLTTNLLRNVAFTIVLSFHSALLFRMNGKNHQSTHGVITFSVAQPLLLTMLTFPCTMSTYTFFLQYAASTIILSA